MAELWGDKDDPDPGPNPIWSIVRIAIFTAIILVFYFFFLRPTFVRGADVEQNVRKLPVESNIVLPSQDE
jgi:hypothetical protein